MTDRQRHILAFVLCGVVLVLFMFWRARQAPEPAATQPTSRPTTSRRVGPTTTTRTVVRPTTRTRPTPIPVPTRPVEHRFVPAGEPPVDDIVLGWTDPENPGGFLLQVVLTNRGAAVTRIALAKVRNADQTGPLVLFGLDAERTVYREDPSLLPAAWPPADRRLFLINDYRETKPRKTFNLENMTFKVVERTAARVVFETTVLPENLRIRKTFELKPDVYTLDLVLEVTNEGEAGRVFSYQLQSASSLPREELRIGRRPPGREVEVALIARGQGGGFSVDRPYTEKLDEGEDGDPDWGTLREGQRLAAAGMLNKYFALMVMPAEASDQQRVHFARARKALDPHYCAELQARQKGDNVNTKLSKRQLDEFATQARLNGSVWLVTRAGEVIEPGHENAWRHHYVLYAGPKDTKALRPYADWGLPEVVSYGIFGPISRLLVWLLHVLHHVPPRNYGLAIILLTIVVRGLMHPLTRKQAHGMRNLQKLKPQIDELKKKFKGDRQALGRAQMDLYKQHGYNPMSGCLPMLLQMPIFIALFQALRVEPALRQAAFIAPITDLARPDTLLPLGFSIPLIFTEITHIRLLPILSMAGMFLSQRLTPKPPTSDQQAATQKKMMVVMFVMFAVMLYNVASGLLLYITVSSFIGVFEQWHIRKGLEKTEDAVPAPAKASSTAAKRPPKSATKRPSKSAAKRRKKRR